MRHARGRPSGDDDEARGWRPVPGLRQHRRRPDGGGRRRGADPGRQARRVRRPRRVRRAGGAGGGEGRPPTPRAGRAPPAGGGGRAPPGARVPRGPLSHAAVSAAPAFPRGGGPGPAQRGDRGGAEPGSAGRGNRAPALGVAPRRGAAGIPVVATRPRGGRAARLAAARAPAPVRRRRLRLALRGRKPQPHPAVVQHGGLRQPVEGPSLPTAGPPEAGFEGATMSESTKDAGDRFRVSLGRCFFGLATLATGVLQLAIGEFVRLVPKLPGWVPAKPALAYLVGIVFVAIGLAILTGRRARDSAAVLAAMILLDVLLLYA